MRSRMSRGLGRFQREILETLDEAKATCPDYQGADYWSTPEHPEGVPGVVRVHGCTVCLADDIYDLRASARFLAKRASAVDNGGGIQPAHQASFSRAVKGL